MLLLIDNYDSFTYNLAQYLGELGQDVQVHRNDAVTLEQIAAWKPEKIVILFGPRKPTCTWMSSIRPTCWLIGSWADRYTATRTKS